MQVLGERGIDGEKYERLVSQTLNDRPPVSAVERLTRQITDAEATGDEEQAAFLRGMQFNLTPAQLEEHERWRQETFGGTPEKPTQAESQLSKRPPLNGPGCTCDIAIGYNVRAADLYRTHCPQHGHLAQNP